MDGSGNVTTMIYDGDGHRVSQTVNGVTTQYLIDDRNPTGYAQVVEEIQNGQVVRVYVYGNDLVAQVSNLQSPVTDYFAYDGHGSTRFLTNASGAVVERYNFDAFGILLPDANGPRAPPITNYLYSGEKYDPNLKVYHLGERDLNPLNDRFETMDSYAGNNSDPQSLHKYLYANADGVNKSDPTGNFSLLDLVMTSLVIGAIAGTTAGTIVAIRGGTAEQIESAVTRWFFIGFAVGAAGYGAAWTYAAYGAAGATVAAGGAGILGPSGINNVQNALMRATDIVTREQAMEGSAFNSYASLRLFLNKLYTGTRFNPLNIQWHHIVGQTTANIQRFGMRAIQSILNIAPTPAAIHTEISAVESSGFSWLPAGYTTLRAYIQTQSYSEQWRINLEIWKHAMLTGGNINPNTIKQILGL